VSTPPTGLPPPCEWDRRGLRRQNDQLATTISDTLQCVLRFGALMLRSGTTAFRVHAGMAAIARALGIEAFAAHIVIDGMIVTGKSGDTQITLASEIAPLGIDAWRISALERLANTAELGVSLQMVATRLDAIEGAPPVHSPVQIVAAVGAASGAFCYLNGGAPLVILAASMCGAVGHAARSALLHRRINQYAVAAVSAVIASGAYCLAAAALSRADVALPHNAAGFISSVLFLVPGFPLVAALLDLVQHQSLAGVSRVAYGGLILVAAGFGLSLVTAAVDLSAQIPPALTLGKGDTIVLRAVASAVGASGFAILFNSPWRSVLAISGFAVLGNELRLAMHDAGISLALATFVGALIVGVLASLLRQRVQESRIALTVPGIIIMVPGMYAFQTVVLFGQGDAVAGIRSAVLGSLVVGAMAAGLVAAHSFTERGWLIES
jgi:uncharacterized membrane protein YjjP (DUF1212 family)